MSQKLAPGIDRLIELLSCPKCHGYSFEVADAVLKCKGCEVVYQTCNGVPIFLPEPESVKIISLDHVSNEISQEVINWLQEFEGYTLNIGPGATVIKLPRCIELEYSVFKHTDIVGDAHHLPFRSGVFDAVVSLNAFEHLHDPFAAAKEIFRVLKPGGKLLIETAFMTPLHDEPIHYFNATEYGLRRWFSEFDVETCEVCNHFNPALALEWLASDILFFVTQTLGSETGQKLAETTLDQWRKAWLDKTGERYGYLYQILAQLPQHIQKRFSAGFQLKAQRPTRVASSTTLSDKLLQKEGSSLEVTVREKCLRIEHLQFRLEENQAELAQSQSQLQQTQAELERLQSQLQSTQAELKRSQDSVIAMESSKFWKLRTAWFRLRKLIKIKENELKGPVAFPTAEQSGGVEVLTVPAAIGNMNSEVVANLGRESIASLYIRGNGIEIGALHEPLKVPKSANVKYVDRMSEPDLRKQYPELKSLELVNVDIIADGELLETIQDSSQDFVIINHFLEHCQNPILAMSNMFRVLKDGGILYVALPDKRYSFDVDRPVTPIEHYWRDYKEGPEWSKRQHFQEWTKLVGKIQDDVEVEKHANWLMDIDYSIHYHVLTQDEMLELILSIKKALNLKFEVELFFKNGTYEVIFVLRKFDG